MWLGVAFAEVGCKVKNKTENSHTLVMKTCEKKCECGDGPAVTSIHAAHGTFF